MTPIRSLMRRPSIHARIPRTVSSPSLGGDELEIIFIVVVLPAPFGPRKPKHSFDLTVKSMPRTASNEPYSLRSPRAETAAPSPIRPSLPMPSTRAGGWCAVRGFRSVREPVELRRSPARDPFDLLLGGRAGRGTGERGAVVAVPDQPRVIGRVG